MKLDSPSIFDRRDRNREVATHCHQMIRRHRMPIFFHFRELFGNDEHRVFHRIGLVHATKRHMIYSLAISISVASVRTATFRAESSCDLNSIP